MKRLSLSALSLLSCIGAAHAQGVTVLSPVSNTFTQTTTATLAAIPSNPSRKQIQICGNTAVNTLNVTFGTIVTPTATLGTPIGANACALFTPAAGSYLGSQINLIAVTGSVVVFYTEYF